MKLLLLSLGLCAVHNFIKLPVKIGFIATAGEVYDDPYFVRNDRDHLVRLGCNIEDIDISNAPRTSIIAQLNNIDCLFVAGGNTFYLMQQIHKKDLAGDLCRRIRFGLPYIGSSAGSAITGPSIDHIRSFDDITQAPDLQNTDGLNLTCFAVLPHAKEKNRPLYDDIVADYKDRFNIVTFPDDQALITEDGKTYQMIPSSIIP